MVNRFTPAGENAINQARAEAEELGHLHIGTEHLLLSLTQIKGSVASELLRAAGVEYGRLKEAVRRISGGPSLMPAAPAEQTPRLKAVLRSASEGKGGAFGRVGTEIILRELLGQSDSTAVRVLESLGISAEELLSEVSSSARSGQAALSVCEDKKVKKFSPTLTKYAISLSPCRTDPVIGREAETESLIRILCRRCKSNPCLIGEPGVGKTAIVEGLAKRIADGDVPDRLRGKTVLSLDVPSMLAGAKYRGEFEDRLKGVLSEVASDPDIILFIDELHTVMGAGASEGAIDASNILKPALARGGLTLIGATTTEEYRRFIERDGAFERRLQPITVREPDTEQTLRVLTGLREAYEEHHGIKITDGAINAAVGLSVRYIPDRRLPDKALDLLDGAAAGKRIAYERARDGEAAVRSVLRGIEASGDRELLPIRDRLLTEKNELTSVLTFSDVRDALSLQLGRSLEPPTASGLSVKIKARVFGQDAAIDRLCSAVTARGVYRKRSGPSASVLICGPSGTGKTLMATALSEAMNGEPPIRFDLSEYADKGSVSSLIGSPPGYVGYGDEGALVRQIRSRPLALLLLENVGGTHPDVLAVVRELLEYGRITSPSGRAADLTNSVVILTATDNRPSLGFVSPPSGGTPAGLLPESIASLTDASVCTQPLTDKARTDIASAALEDLRLSLNASGIELKYDGELCRHCAEGAARLGGGRSVAAYVKEKVEAPVLARIGEGEGEKFSVLYENGIFSVKAVTTEPLSAYNAVKEEKQVMP